MGCSPSKGNNLGAQGPFRKGRTLLPVTQESTGESQSDDGVSGGSNRAGETDGEMWERGGREMRPTGKTHSSQREAPSTPQKKRPSLPESVPEVVILDKPGAHETDINTGSQGKDKQGDKRQDAADKKGGRKPKKNGKGVKQSKKKEKEKKTLIVEEKVDFPEPLVKAHQAAYAFLNPSITKYDILLGLLDQATQTQVSVQPMVSFMAMRYEGINRGLEEMANEGEKLLKENGEHLAWPSQMRNLSTSSPSKCGSTNAEPPPDLLHQLLQYTTQRMRNVGQSVGGIGDSALEEAAEYFASVSELLEEKLKAKRVTEARLMQLLTRIEAASLRKPGPEDSALFSEDSGIGAESESLAGSERRRRRWSSESTGTIRNIPCSPKDSNTTPVRQIASRRKLNKIISPSISLNSIDSRAEQKDTESLLGSASLDDGEEEEDDDEGDEEGDGNGGSGRKRSNSSPSDSTQQPCRLLPKRIENPQNVEMTLKMKDAISGRIRFVPSQGVSARAKLTDSPNTSRHQWTEGEQSPKRPQTAAPVGRTVKKTLATKGCRSRSAESHRSKTEDPTLLELERTQRDLSHRLERMSKGNTGGKTKTNPPKQSQGDTASNRLCPSLGKNSNSLPIKDQVVLLRRNTGEQAGKVMEEEKKKKHKKTAKGPLKATRPEATTPEATPPPSPSLSSHQPTGLYRGRNSVKRLIDTFSQGGDEPKQDPSKVLGPLRGVQKCGVPVMPGAGNIEAMLSSCRTENILSEKTDDMDLDNLPPPPIEVLMDNSFEGAQSLPDDGIASRGRSPVPKRAIVSQKLRASMSSVNVLPSRGSLPQGSKSMSPGRTVRQDFSACSRIGQHEAQSEVDSETEEAATLYKQARKVIHLQHSSESTIEKPQADPVPRKPSLDQAGLGGEQGGNSPPKTVPPTPVVSSQLPVTPPGSRSRLLPATPSTPSSLHRRLPSPPTFKRQPTPPSQTGHSVICKLPNPPPLQRRLPSPPTVKQEVTPNPSSASTYSFKAPSPPASPKLQRWSREKAPSPPASPRVQRWAREKAPSPPASPRVQRWTRETSSEDSTIGGSSISKLVSNVRSVFCPASRSLFEAQPCPVPRPPLAWASGCVLPRPWRGRGRLPTSVRGPLPFIRRSQSDRRPSVSLPPRTATRSVAETCGSEPAINMQGLDDEPTREEELWENQSDLRTTTRSLSHPDLCIVGQALQRECGGW